MDTLAKRLKAARLHLGLRQDDVARASGLKQSDISKMENGLILKTTGILALARALKCDPHWLESGEGEMTAPERWPYTQEGIAQFQKLTPEQLRSVKEFTDWKLSQAVVPTHQQTLQADTIRRSSPTKSDWEGPQSKVQNEHEQRDSVKAAHPERGGG